MKVMTFNIRNSGARDGVNAWPFRKSAWISTVRKFDPDLLGVQEVLLDQHGDLSAEFTDYGLAGVARGDGKQSDEWALILYRKSAFELLEAGDFWISETPEMAGSMSWETACCRICSWAKLKSKSTGQSLVFANTHLDHESAEARFQGAKLLIARLVGRGPLILTGDFNSTEVDPPHAVLTSAGLVDSYRAVHPKPAEKEGSFHGYQNQLLGKRIDWILHTTDFTAKAAEIDRTAREDGGYPSDHFAVTATF